MSRSLTYLEILEHRHNAWTVLELAGELGSASSGQLRNRVALLVEARASSLIVVLDRLAFLDSSGLAALVGALRAVRGVGGELRMVATDPRWVQLLDRSGLLRVLPPYRSVVEAAAGS